MLHKNEAIASFTFRSQRSKIAKSDEAGKASKASRTRATRRDTSDRARFREALASAASRIQPPRGPIQFDRYQQVITPVYVMKVERRGNRLVNAIVDRISSTSQEESWKWWHR